MIRAGKYDAVHHNYSPAVIFDCVAFSNSTGGYIHIGPEDGVQDPLAVEENIRAALSELVSPNDLSSLARISRKEIGGNAEVKVLIPARPLSLHYIEHLGLEHGVFIRDGAKTVSATPTQVAQLLDRACLIWEKTPFLLKHSPHFHVSYSSLEQYCKDNDCKDVYDTLLKMNGLLLCKDERPTNLGFLFSDSCAPQIQICDESASPKRTTYHECCGPYFSQIIAAKQQLSGYNPYRNEHTYALPHDYPLDSLTALLYHAVRYRDYSLPGEIIFRIKKDKIEVTYPGTLLFPLRLDDYLNGASCPKNPEISNALDTLGIEIINYTNFGSIMVIYSSYGVELEYLITDHMIRITLPNLNHCSAVKAYPQLSRNQRAILDLIFFQCAITRDDVEKQLALPQATATRTLNALVQKGLIEEIVVGKSTLYRHLPPSEKTTANKGHECQHIE